MARNTKKDGNHAQSLETNGGGAIARPILCSLFLLLTLTVSHAQCFSPPQAVLPQLTLLPQYWAPGQSYNVVVTNPQAYFTLYTPAPGHVPATAYVLTSASFYAGNYYAEDPNVTVTLPVYVSPTEITFTATVASGAPTEADGWSLPCQFNTVYLNPGSIEITPCALPVIPNITSIQPPAVVAGASTPITVTGTGFIPTSNPNNCAPSLFYATVGGVDVPISNVTVVSPTQITAVIAPSTTGANPADVAPEAVHANDSTDTATVTVSNYQYNSPLTPATATAAEPILQVSLVRADLMDIQATGTPTGGSFSFTTLPQSGTTNAAVAFSSGENASTNPNTVQLSDPANPSPSGIYSPGGLEQITVKYTLATVTASDKFLVPTFGMSCYDTTLQSDWGTSPTKCLSLTYQGVTYSGTVTNPAGLTGTYCSSFIHDVVLNTGSGYLNNGQAIQVNKGTIVPVNTIKSADGTPVVANQTVSRDKSIISGKGVLIDLDQVGSGLLANDTGGGIKGYRIDLYKGTGSAVCAAYENIMAVGACTPATSGCPSSTVK